MKINELHNQPVEADTYEASMALNQLLKIGRHAIKIHNMIDDSAEMEAWVAKKIDLAGDYVKKVHGYMQGEKAGLYDDGGLTEDAGSLTDQQKKGLTLLAKKYSGRKGVNGDPLIRGWITARTDSGVTSDGWDSQEVEAWEKKTGKDLSDWSPEDDKQFINQNEISRDMEDELLRVMGDDDFFNKPVAGEVLDFIDDLTGPVSEDAGEGHMSKSTLYHTAKYAIELMDMINQGDDLEGWVQSKLNKAADYLQGVHNYEEYQKLNPYREELDSELLQKHAGIIQKNIDEILARETSLDDVDTKPGMMRILAKRVNEVEKEIAKEQRKNTDEAHGGQHSTSGRSMTKGEMNKREKIVKGMKKNKAGFKKRYGKDAEAVMYATATKNAMKDDEATESGILYRAGVKKYGKAGMKAIQSAAGKGASHQEIGKIKDKHLKDDEAIEEGLKDWAKKTAMAGVIVAGLAGIGSISDAIDNSIPAISAMETALEMAEKSGNDELAKMIEKDLSDAKIRLSSGKDLSHVTDLQNKYAKFIKTEGLAYESKLAVSLNQRLK